MTDTRTQTVSKTLAAPGATLTYDVREVAGSDERPMMLVGSPMGAEGFGSSGRR